MKKKRIIPSIPSGFRDFLPQEMIARQWMVDTIRNVFERFGFVPLDTSGIEKEEILTGGDENFRMQIFRTDQQIGGDKLALRFDLTVPLARVIAQYPNEIKKPFKRYQIGKVWRAEKPQAGRYREFMQFDADVVGTRSMMADAEIIAMMYEVMTSLDIEHFMIRVNNRKILNGLADYAEFSKEKIVDVLRTIDKLDRHRWDVVRSELENICNLTVSQIDRINIFLGIVAENQDQAIVLMRELMGNSSAIAQEGIKELSEIISHVRALGIPNEKWKIDFSVARGLGYYTGPVFETILTDFPDIGSVFSGGRYDDLVERFSPISVSATGASVGVDRLFLAMEKLHLFKKENTTTQVIILNFDDGCEEYLERVASLLRCSGIPTEIYFGNEKTITAQLAFALNTGIPVAVIVGSREMMRDVVQVKHLVQRTQEEISFHNIVKYISNLIS